MKKLLNKLTNIANSKRLPTAQAQFAQLEKFLGSLDANDVADVTPYVKAAAYHFEFALTQPMVDDKKLANSIQDMQQALRINVELEKRLRAKTQADFSKLSNDQVAQLEKYDAERTALENAIAADKRQLSLQEMIAFNQRKAKMLESAFDEKNLPKFTPTSANKKADKNGWMGKIAHGISDFFENLASGNDIKDTIQSFLKTIVGFLANMFLAAPLKKFIGEDKADKLAENVGTSLDNFINDGYKKEAKEKIAETQKEEKKFKQTQFANYKEAKKLLNKATHPDYANAKLELKRVFKI